MNGNTRRIIISVIDNCSMHDLLYIKRLCDTRGKQMNEGLKALFE